MVDEVMQRMMKKLVSIIAFLSLLTACEREKPLQEPTIVYDMDTTSTSTSTEFSYVADLSLEKREAYQAFLNDGEIRHLQTFSPEEMLLIMFDLVEEPRMDALYAITYSNDAFPTKELFEQYYTDSLAGDLLVTYFMYRFFDRIVINESSTPDLQVVQLKISVGSQRYIKTYALQQQEGIWKVHLAKDQRGETDD